MLLYFLTVFFISVISLYLFWKVRGIGKYVMDHNKPRPRNVPVGGGLIVVFTAAFFYLLYGILSICDYKIMVSIAGMMIVAFLIGFYDDLKGIRKWKKVPILSVASIPILAAYFIVQSNLWEPTIIGINFSIFYWIVIIPIVVAGFANGGNVIAGYDGMETGVYVLISGLYLIIGFIINSRIISILSGTLFFSLLAMLIFNWYPSKLLLGNVGSYPISASLGIIPLIGHFEIVLPIVFLPHLIEVALQLKYTRKYKYDVFGDVDENGIIHNKYGIMSILHWIISWGNMTEKKVTMAMLGIEAALCAIAFLTWYLSYIL